MESIKKDDLSIIAGCCCNYALCYLTMPDCIGCASEQECLCCGQKHCFKLGANCYWCKGDEASCCQLGCGFCAIFLKTPATCCKSEAQCCCCLQSCSVPPTQDMPCIVAAYFLTCYPSCGCCKKFSTVVDKA